MFVVNNEYWEVLIVAPNDINLLMPNGEFAWGACSDIDKTIFINGALSDEDFELVLTHEIVHSFARSFDVPLTYEEEELIAEVIAVFGEDIINIANVVFNRLKQLRGRY